MGGTPKEKTSKFKGINSSDIEIVNNSINLFENTVMNKIIKNKGYE